MKPLLQGLREAGMSATLALISVAAMAVVLGRSSASAADCRLAVLCALACLPAALLMA